MSDFLIAIGLKTAFYQTQCTSPIWYFSVFKNLSDDLSLAMNEDLCENYLCLDHTPKSSESNTWKVAMSRYRASFYE